MKTATNKPTKFDIEHERLPNRCLVDTGVFIRALGYHDDEHRLPCVAFFEAMLQTQGKQILLAAPVLAELIRGGPDREIPRTPHVAPVSFDLHAARICGKEMPPNILRRFANGPYRLTYLKYDAMIVACAKRWEAECIVAIDTDHHKLASHVNIPVHHPREFRRAQMPLFSPTRPTSP